VQVQVAEVGPDQAAVLLLDKAVVILEACAAAREAAVHVILPEVADKGLVHELGAIVGVYLAHRDRAALAEGLPPIWSGAWTARHISPNS
jgi:hypothetical protein